MIMKKINRSIGIIQFVFVYLTWELSISDVTIEVCNSPGLLGFITIVFGEFRDHHGWTERFTTSS